MLKRGIMKMNVVGAALVLSVMLFSCQNNDKGESTTYQESNYVNTTTIVKKDFASYLEYSGKLFSEKSANIAPDVAAKVLKFAVKKGDYVYKDDLLAIMDSTQFVQAKAQYESAAKSYRRMLKLKETGTIDQQSFDQVEAGYITAKAAYKFMKGNSKVRAPFDGFITEKLKNAGEVYMPMSFSAAGPAILRLVNIDNLKAKVQVSDRDIAKIKLTRNVIINTESYPDQQFMGRVSFISQEADLMSGTFTVEIKIDNKDRKLKPNQFVRLSIAIEEQKDALVIPKQALLKNSSVVFIVNNNIAERRAVTTGIESENEIQVVSGVSEGEMVITRGNVGLKDSTKVLIKNK
jgi:RND family efflux transporter MFP subunit